MNPPSLPGDHPGTPGGGAGFSAADACRLAKRLFPTGPLLFRKLQHWRPRICPFEVLVPHVPPGAAVLDVGCGGGLWLGLLSALGRVRSATGFDSAAKAIALASRMALPAGAVRPAFQHLPVQAEWPAGLFSCVSIIDVMHHVPSAAQQAVIAMAAARLAPGGVLIYKDMCRRPAWRAVANRMHDLALARQWIHYAPIDRVEQWAGRAGLTLAHAETINRLWYGHELRVFRKPPAPQGR